MTAHRDRIELVSKIVPLREKGLSYAVIARLVGLHKSWVSKLYRKWRFSVESSGRGEENRAS